MGRKKKEKVKEQTKVTPPDNISVVVYNNVKITEMKKGVKVRSFEIKNAGTKQLFMGLCQFLDLTFHPIYGKGNAAITMSSFIPVCMGAGISSNSATIDFDSEELTDEVSTSDRQPILTTNIQSYTDKVSNNKYVKIVYSAKISNEYLGGAKVYQLGLFSHLEANTGGLLAGVNIMNPDNLNEAGYTLPPGFDWVVEWSISFGNTVQKKEGV